MPQASLNTALLYAIKAHDRALVKRLLRQGADANAPIQHQTYSVSPLSHAALAQAPLAIDEALLESGARPNQVDLDGMTPVLMAVGTRQPQRVLRLAQAGGRAIQDIRGQTVWHIWANPEGTSSVVRLIFRDHLHTLGLDKIQEDPEPMAEALRAIGAQDSLHQPNDRGVPPLWIALEQHRWPVITAMDALGLEWLRPLRNDIFPEQLLAQLSQDTSLNEHSREAVTHWQARVVAEQLAQGLQSVSTSSSGAARPRL